MSASGLLHFSISALCCSSFLLFISTVPSGVDGLKLTNMSVPAVVDFRESIGLDCRFDMEGEELYAVKWYKDDQEFFRYMPTKNLEDPIVKFYAVQGVTLSKEETNCGNNRCKIQLTNLIRTTSSGAYRCEVSTEAPAFKLASETHKISVLGLPKGGPTMELNGLNYHEDDILTATCHSPAADPVPELRWYINDLQVFEPQVKEIKSGRRNPDGLLSRSLILSIRLEKSKYPTSPVSLACSSLFPSFPMSFANQSISIKFKNQQEDNSINRMFHSWHRSQGLRLRGDLLLIIFLAVVRW